MITHLDFNIKAYQSPDAWICIMLHLHPSSTAGGSVRARFDAFAPRLGREGLERTKNTSLTPRGNSLNCTCSAAIRSGPVPPFGGAQGASFACQGIAGRGKEMEPSVFFQWLQFGGFMEQEHRIPWSKPSAAKQ